MDRRDYEMRDALDLSALIRKREISAAELRDVAQACLDARNPALNAVIGPTDRSAEQAIAAIDEAAPFAGVPFLIKDVAHGFAGELQEEGSPSMSGQRALTDSALAVRFKAAGLVTIGRTNVPEFAGLLTTESEANGPCRNPWDLSCSAGGSSGGAAAAVAAGIVPVAHASDGAGSIRTPASACGLVGLKPSRGRVPRGRAAYELSLGGSRGVDFIVSRSVRDSFAMLDAISGPCTGDYVALPKAAVRLGVRTPTPARLRIAVSHGYAAAPSPECTRAVDLTAALCIDLGHHVEPSTPELFMPAIRKACEDASSLTFAAQVSKSEALNGPVDLSLFERSTVADLERGRRLGIADLADAYDVFNSVAFTMGDFFQTFDILLRPTLTCPPFPLETLYPQAPNADIALIEETSWQTIAPLAVANIAGTPAISLPLHLSADGMPIGIELAAAYGREDLLASLAYELEAARPWQALYPFRRQGETVAASSRA